MFTAALLEFILSELTMDIFLAGLSDELLERNLSEPREVLWEPSLNGGAAARSFVRRVAIPPLRFTGYFRGGIYWARLLRPLSYPPLKARSPTD